MILSNNKDLMKKIIKKVCFSNLSLNTSKLHKVVEILRILFNLKTSAPKGNKIKDNFKSKQSLTIY